jgi:CelD/BcsL family acetyltransferase involved in cellulose biosynthesis
LRGDWDALADAARQPAAASAWLGAWADHVSVGSPRVAVVREAGVMLGIVPLTAEPWRAGSLRLHLLGAGTSTGVAPLARPGAEATVAAAAARALAAHGPADALVFDGIPVTSPWPQLLAHHWPGARARLLHRVSTSPEPYVTLDADSYEDWLQTRSSSFRAQVRKVGRRLDRRGVTTRRSGSAAELADDLRAFLALHNARWAAEGGSGVITPAVERMLFEAGPRLLAAGRLDLWSMEAGGRTVCSQICLLSEGYATLWLQGYDQTWAGARLGLSCMAQVIEDGFERGMQRISLGEGGQEYKYRFADGEERLAWSVLPLPGPRLGVVLAGLQGRRMRRAVGRRLGPARKAQVRRVLRRPRAA